MSYEPVGPEDALDPSARGDYAGRIGDAVYSPHEGAVPQRTDAYVLASGTPASGDTLVFDAGSGTWVPGTPAAGVVSTERLLEARGAQHVSVQPMTWTPVPLELGKPNPSVGTLSDDAMTLEVVSSSVFAVSVSLQLSPLAYPVTNRSEARLLVACSFGPAWDWSTLDAGAISERENILVSGTVVGYIPGADAVCPVGLTVYCETQAWTVYSVQVSVFGPL